MRKITQSGISGGGPRQPLPAGDQGEPEGDAADRRQAADPVRGRGGRRRRHHRHDLHHRPQQARRSRTISTRPTSSRPSSRCATRRRCSRRCRSATPPGINCIYIRQTEALGLGHAVLCAAPVVGDEPFAVLLADDLIDAEVPVMQQMVDVAMRENASVDRRDGRAGGRRRQLGHRRDRPDGRAGRAASRASSRSRSRAPRRRRWRSSAATCCRRAIFHHLRTMPPGAGGEIQLTDGIARLLDEETVLRLSRSRAGATTAAASSAISRRPSTYGLKHPGSSPRISPRSLRERATRQPHDDVERASLDRRRRRRHAPDADPGSVDKANGTC